MMKKHAGKEGDGLLDFGPTQIGPDAADRYRHPHEDRIKVLEDALREAALDLCPFCGVHVRLQRRNRVWVHDEGENRGVCKASKLWDVLMPKEVADS